MNWMSLSICALRPAKSLLTVFMAVSVLGACSGSSNTTPATTTTPTATVLTPALFAFYDSDGDNNGDSIARIDLSTDAIMKTAVTGMSGTGGTHKQAFYDGPLWVGAGFNVWGIDPDTLQVIPRQTPLSIQGNREGTIGAAIVNSALSLVQALGFSSANASVQNATADAEKAKLSQYFNRASFTWEEAQTVDFCAVQDSRSGVDSKLAGNVMAAAIAVPQSFHNMGYTPVGIEPLPNGKLTEISERLGDHSFYLDTDPNSPTFGYPVRFVYPRLGIVKDQNNAVLTTFTGKYTTNGGTAPGRLNYNRASTGTSEVDKNTYSEPCDSTALRNAQGQVWTWWPDVNGDTLTGVNNDALMTATPQIVQVAVPITARTTAPASRGGVGSASATACGGPCSPNGQRVGPWMASLANRNNDGHFILHVETEGDQTEMLWDVTNPANVFEIERIVGDLKTVLTPDLATQTPGSPTAFTNGTIYTVLVNYVSTGGTSTSVNYQYVSLPGDSLTGINPDQTRSYLKKVSATDPGPNYILSGLNARASTSEANMARRQGSGTDGIVFSDEIWLLSSTPLDVPGANNFQIIDMRVNAPYPISETFGPPSAFSGSFSPDGKKFFQIGTNQGANPGKIEVIDTVTRNLIDVITLPGPATGYVFGSYHAPVVATTPSSGGTSGGGSSGGGSGGGLPPNPCGG